MTSFRRGRALAVDFVRWLSAGIAGSGLLLASCGSDPALGRPGTGGRAASGAAGRIDDAGPVGSGGSTGTGGQGAGGIIATAGAAGSSRGGAGSSGADACGDGKATGLEPCDGADLRGARCADFGFDEGELRCDMQACFFDVSGCMVAPTPAGACGNGKIDSGEECDGADLGGRRCEDVGRVSGALSCSTLCTVVTTGCKPPVCGDGIAGNGEACDAEDLHGLTCMKLGYPSGTLQCKKDSCELDESKCEHCGDGLIENGEACDGSMLGHTTCRSLGFSGGPLACVAGCKLDTHACARCGNGTIEGGENCDGTALGGATCASLGLPTGTLECSPSCLYDVGACGSSVPRCGDGIVESGEDCDGKDLTGLDCDALGKDGGTLGCSATCRFDTAGCVEPPPPDPCRDCRTERCAPQLDACKADVGCLGLFDCMKRCATAPDDSCWFRCGTPPAGAPPGPSEEEATKLLLAVAAFSCTSSACASECGGSL